MYCRIYEPNRIVINTGEKVSELMFIKEGGFRLQERHGIHDFLILPPLSFFGDYQILFQLKSNMVVRALKGNENTICMCVSKKVLKKVLKQYPRSRNSL